MLQQVKKTEDEIVIAGKKYDEYMYMLDTLIVIGAMATTGGDAEEAARLLGVTVEFINERF